MLSPHLRFGEVSPFEVWHRMRHGLGAAAAKNREKFLSEIGWREFSYHILFHHPDLATRNYRADFDAFPWTRPGKPSSTGGGTGGRASRSSMRGCGSCGAPAGCTTACG